MEFNNLPGIFISIEGIEGVGKSTALKFMQKYLVGTGKQVITTREPGGTPIAEAIRKILLSHDDESITPVAELLLMFASRAQHIEHFILPHLRDGAIVISDRFVDASFAYQGGGRQIPNKTIEQIETIVSLVTPDLTILLDAPAELGCKRAKNRGEQDRIEKETLDFFARVRNAYLERAKTFPARFKVIDATQSLNEVHENIQLVISELMNQHAGFIT